MALFTNHPIVSPFLTTNELMAPGIAADHRQNALFMQNLHQQDYGLREREFGLKQREFDARFTQDDFGGKAGQSASATSSGSDAGGTFAGGIAGMESGGNANPGDNPLWPVAQGGPDGAHGFVAKTWRGFVAANPDLFQGMSPEQVLAARRDPALSEKATNWYAGENTKALTSAGIQPTPGNLGIAHALGAGGATKVLGAPDTTPLAQLIPETVPKNPQYGRMTVGDLKQKYAKLGPVGGQGAAAPQMAAGDGALPPPYQVAGATVGPPAAPTGAPQGPSSNPAEIIAIASAARAILARPPAERAAAYGPAVQQLQAQGMARNAPPQYPGDAVLERLSAGGGQSVPRETQAPGAATITPPPPTNARKLTDEQVGQLSRMRQAGIPTAAAEIAFVNHNETQRHQYQSDLRQAGQDAATVAERTRAHGREDTKDARDAAEAEQKLKAGAAPIPGTGDHAAMDNTLLTIGPKIRAGTETEAERDQYTLHYDRYKQGDVQAIPDPTDPTGQRMMLGRVPREVPARFPAPDYRPGAAATTPAAGAVPIPGTQKPAKDLPEAERTKLLDASQKMDQLYEATAGFKPEYAGFGSSMIGDAANTLERNTGGGPRSEWWQNYQRAKLAVRQGISGQSLTATEMSEFEKADINPGMSSRTIKDNLKHQLDVLHSAQDRRVRTLGAEGYNPKALEESSRVQKSAPVAADSASAHPPLPPGFKVIQ